MSDWWSEQQAIWPVGAALLAPSADRTAVHVIGERERRDSFGQLRVHPSRTSGPSLVPFGFDWSVSMERALRRLGPNDVCIIHGSDSPGALLAASAASRSTVVAVYHGGSTGGLDTLKRITGLHVVLRAEVRDELISLGIDEHQIIETTPSAGPTFFEVQPKASSDAVVVGYIGRLTHGKGADALVPTLVDASRRLGTHIRLEVLGGTHQTERARYLSDRSSTDFSVDFLGHRPNREVASAMAGWDALLLPSRFEGCPRSVIEAIAVGIPTVGVHGVLPDKLVDSRLVFVGDRSSLGATLANALTRADEQPHVTAPTHGEQAAFWEQVARTPVATTRRMLRPATIGVRARRLSRVAPLRKAVGRAVKPVLRRRPPRSGSRDAAI